MAQYLVTGGCGFIGSHLVETLQAQGHFVRVFDDLSTGKRENIDSRAELVVGDVGDFDTVAACMKDMDGCFHLAAIASVQRSTEQWLACHRTNLGGTIAVLDAAHKVRGQACPVVFASSAAIYGKNSDIPLREAAATAPTSAYGADKLGSEQHGAVAAGLFGMGVTGMRFFNVFGPRQDPSSPYSGVISIFCDRIAAGRPISIFGDGLQSRDFIYVSDVVRFLIAAMQNSRPGAFNVFNVCTGREITLLDLALAIMKITGNEVAIQHGAPRMGDIRHSLGDPSRAAVLLKVKAEIGIFSGLAGTLRELEPA